MVVSALQIVTPEQRAVLVDNYGRNDSTGVEKVKTLYRELKLPEKFAAFEESSFKSINTLVEVRVI